MLPGQRDGSLLWYKDITEFLKSKLDMVEHEPYPCVLATRDRSCVVMIHVDDMLIVGHNDVDQEFALGKFMDTMRSKYDISIDVLEKPGDEVSFLKRSFLLHEDGRLTIQTRHKHVSQMNPKQEESRSCRHGSIGQQSRHAGRYGHHFPYVRGRPHVLASDMSHCQHVIRHLSTYNAKPTVKSLTVLKHLVAYLACHGGICISLKWIGRNNGVFCFHADLNTTQNIFELFTDSDWACDKATRRSISCCTVFFGGCLLYSASRIQRIVSLSSAEAEVYACSSGAADSLLLARLVSWLSGKETKIHFYTDSSCARGSLQRKGVGRLRHLSCRILWLQNLFGVGAIKLSAVSGNTNPADIGTMRLTANRLRSSMSLLGLYNMSTNTVEVQTTLDAFSSRGRAYVHWLAP